jgi:hypothetical protein
MAQESITIVVELCRTIPTLFTRNATSDAGVESYV